MDYLEEDVHDLDARTLGNLVIARVEESGVTFLEIVLVQNRRTLRTWYRELFDAADFSGELAS